MAAVFRSIHKQQKPPRIPSDQIDRSALEQAWRRLGLRLPLDQMLQNQSHRIVLENVARRVIQQRSTVDIKKLQANDND